MQGYIQAKSIPPESFCSTRVAVKQRKDTSCASRADNLHHGLIYSNAQAIQLPGDAVWITFGKNKEDINGQFQAA